MPSLGIRTIARVLHKIVPQVVFLLLIALAGYLLVHVAGVSKPGIGRLYSNIYYFLYSLVALGYQRVKQQSGLRLEDLWDLDDENKTEGIVKRFLPNYEAEVEKKKTVSAEKKNRDGTPVLENQTNVLFPLLRTFGWNLLGIAFIKLVASLLTFVSPTVLNSLITFVRSDGECASSKRWIVVSIDEVIFFIVVMLVPIPPVPVGWGFLSPVRIQLCAPKAAQRLTN